MRASLVLAVALTACGPEYMSTGEFLHDFPGPGPDCRGDRTCAQVNRELDIIQGEIGSFCGTEIMRAEHRLLQLGEPSVPTLMRSLEVSGWVRPHFSALLLSRLHHDADLSAWCRAHSEHENFPWACQGLTPWSVLAGAGEL
jgi:hypothetical protein